VTTLEKYTKLKKRLDAIERQRQQHVGALDQLLKRLKQEFGCVSLKEAKIKLRKLTREHQQKEAEFEKLFNKFYNEHRELLEEESDED
jgi:hypothetical protein